MSARHAVPSGDASHATGGHATGHDAHSHEMHLPHGSIWPVVLAGAMTLLGVGLLVFGSQFTASLHSDVDPATNQLVGEPYRHWEETRVGQGLLLVGLAALVGALTGWFFEDYRWWNSNTGTGTTIPMAGALLFISSEFFLFGALFTNYFTFQHMAHATGMHWPDVVLPGGHHFELPLIKTGIFSLFLFASSATIHIADKALREGNHKKFVNFWGLTIVLGAIFLAGQVWEYYNLIHEGATLGSSQFITAFYILTGTHGLHVFGGLCVLLVMWLRARKGQFTAERHAGPAVASLYWHFVDAVWVVVFTVLYILPIL